MYKSVEMGSDGSATRPVTTALCRGVPVLARGTIAYQASYLISHKLLLIIGAAACLLMLALEGEVVADDAAGLGAVLVVQHRSVCKVTQRCKLLLHVQNIAVRINSLRKILTSMRSRGPDVSKSVYLCQVFSHRV